MTEPPQNNAQSNENPYLAVFWLFNNLEQYDEISRNNIEPQILIQRGIGRPLSKGYLRVLGGIEFPDNFEIDLQPGNVIGLGACRLPNTDFWKWDKLEVLGPKVDWNPKIVSVEVHTKELKGEINITPPPPSQLPEEFWRVWWLFDSSDDFNQAASGNLHPGQLRNGKSLTPEIQTVGERIFTDNSSSEIPGGKIVALGVCKKDNTTFWKWDKFEVKTKEWEPKIIHIDMLNNKIEATVIDHVTPKRPFRIVWWLFDNMKDFEEAKRGDGINPDKLQKGKRITPNREVPGDSKLELPITEEYIGKVIGLAACLSSDDKIWKWDWGKTVGDKPPIILIVPDDKRYWIGRNMRSGENFERRGSRPQEIVQGLSDNGETMTVINFGGGAELSYKVEIWKLGPDGKPQSKCNWKLLYNHGKERGTKMKKYTIAGKEAKLPTFKIRGYGKINIHSNFDVPKDAQPGDYGLVHRIFDLNGRELDVNWMTIRIITKAQEVARVRAELAAEEGKKAEKGIEKDAKGVQDPKEMLAYAITEKGGLKRVGDMLKRVNDLKKRIKDIPEHNFREYYAQQARTFGQTYLTYYRHFSLINSEFEKYRKSHKGKDLNFCSKVTFEGFHQLIITIERDMRNYLSILLKQIKPSDNIGKSKKKKK